MKIFFFGDSLKNLTKTTRRPFLTGFQFSFLDFFYCLWFLSKKYDKSIYNILENCHNLSLFLVENGHYLALFYVQQSFFIHFF